MTPRELLVQLREQGVEIKSNGDRLLIDAPKGAITPDVRDALAANKAELLKILNTPPPTERAAASRPVEKSTAPRPIEPIASAPMVAVPPPRPQPAAQPSVRPISPSAPPEVDDPRATSSIAAEIEQLETELLRLRTEEDARRAEFETSRLAAEHLFHQESTRWRQEQEQAALRRAEQEKLRIEAEAREQAAEETRRRIAEEELKRVEEELRRMHAMEENRRAEVEAQFQTAQATHQAELEQIRRYEAEQVRTRTEEERRFLDNEARKRAQEDEVRRRAQMRIAAVEEEILRLRLRQDAMVKSAEQARLLAEDTHRRRVEEEARRHAEAEALERADQEARLRAEIEAQMRAEVEAQRRIDEEARKRVEDEARRRAQQEAERLASEQSRRAAEEEVRRRAEEEQRRRVEAEARRRAAEEAQRQAEEDAQLRAEQEGRQREEAERRQQAELEARIRAEVEAKLRAEERQRAAELDSLDDPEFARSSAEWFRGGEESEFHPVSLPESEDTVPSPTSRSFALDSRNQRDRAAAVRELANRDSEDAFVQINEAFDDPAPEVRNAAARALFEFQEDRAAAFTRALRDSPADRRARIGAAIAESGLADQAINNLTGESRDRTYDAFSLLFLMSKSGELNPLLRAIEEHPSTEARLAVVKLVALSGQPEVLPAFRRMAVRGSLPPEVRSAVMEAIYQISSQPAGEGQPAQ